MVVAVTGRRSLKCLFLLIIFIIIIIIKTNKTVLYVLLVGSCSSNIYKGETLSCDRTSRSRRSPVTGRRVVIITLLLLLVLLIDIIITHYSEIVVERYI